jgi:hypothetical protein
MFHPIQLCVISPYVNINHLCKIIYITSVVKLNVHILGNNILVEYNVIKRTEIMNFLLNPDQ